MGLQEIWHEGRLQVWILPPFQVPGMLSLPIFYIHKMAAQSPPDVTSSHSVHIFDCVQVIYASSSYLYVIEYVSQLQPLIFLVLL